MLRRSLLLACLVLSPAGSLPAIAADVVPIVVNADRPGETAAAEELGRLLAAVYPDTEFKVQSTPKSDAGPVIHVGTIASAVAPLTDELKGKLKTSGSYVVFNGTIDGRPSGCIVGADLDGLRQGIYGLARKLGWGFYFSFDTPPERTSGEFSFDGWTLDDRPLVPVRMTFDWHNFLSGCSTWNLEDWQHWIAQSQKLGYNAVMVHAYGNNPMAGFTFQGVQKPVGYLSSTRVGPRLVDQPRRTTCGGSSAARSSIVPVFGCDAAIEGTDAERTAAAQKLMAGAFAVGRGSRRRASTSPSTSIRTSANPQELIGLLPEVGRSTSSIGGSAGSLATRHAGGLRLLQGPGRGTARRLSRRSTASSSGIARGARRGWSLPPSGCPRAGEKSTRRSWPGRLEAAKLWHAHNLFAQAKIVEAFQRAVRELGRDDVRIAFGSWDFLFLPAADRFLPEGVALIPLDWMVLRDASVFDAAERRAAGGRSRRTPPGDPDCLGASRRRQLRRPTVHAPGELLRPAWST